MMVNTTQSPERTRLTWTSGDKKVRIDFSSLLTPCVNEDGDPGSWCGENCYRNYYWCLEGYSDSCNVPGGQFTTNNRALCGNKTVWINQTCEVFYADGDKVALGLRCTGDAQHCSYPWYLSGNFYHEVSEQLII